MHLSHSSRRDDGMRLRQEKPMPDEKRTSTDFCGKVFIGAPWGAFFGLW